LENENAGARLEFIRVELKTGTTFAELARTEYRLGHEAHGDELCLKADRAWQEAVKWTGRAAERRIEVGDERQAGETLRLLLVDVRKGRP
jgi:hypothetical protein